MTREEKLNHLIDILRARDEKSLRMRLWFTQPPVDKRGLSSHYDPDNLKQMDCNTVACAGGWACLDPTFNALGLNFDFQDSHPTYEDELGFEALQKFFELDVDADEYTEVYRIFDAGEYTLGGEATVNDVITRIEEIRDGK